MQIHTTTVAALLRRVCLVGLAGFGLACSGFAPRVQATEADLAAKAQDLSRIETAIVQQGRVRVIVELGGAGQAIPADQSQQTSDGLSVRVAAAQQAVLADHLGSDSAKRTRWDVRTISHSPLMAMTVSRDELVALAGHAGIVRISEDKMNFHTLQDSVPLIGMASAYAAGGDGSNAIVAIIDTGVDKTHDFFAGGKVIAEACFGTTATYSNAKLASNCPGGAASSTATGSAVPTACVNASGCDHGTHVAGIAAGNASARSPANGVAKNANVMAVAVFTTVTYTGAGTNPCGSAAQCVTAYDSDIIAGLNYVYGQRANFSGKVIAAINMSLGDSSLNTGYCDQSAFKTPIDLLRSTQIATVIAAGNEYRTTGVASPACVSSAIAVGSTTKTDGVSGFSNVGFQVRVFAPGQSITSSVFSNAMGTKSGTSMATPHVVGAFAAIRSQVPSATVDQIVNAMQSTGSPVTDTTPRADGSSVGSGLTIPRIRVDLALNQLLAAPGVKSEMSVPGSLYILTGAAQQFLWSTGFKVTQYWLSVGTTGVGSSNLFNASMGTAVTTTLTNMPTNGGAIYIRIYSLIGGAWQFSDTTTTAATLAPVKAVLTSPAPGAFVASSATFAWTTGTGVSLYYLSVGTTTGGSEIYGQVASGTTATVTGIAPIGGFVFVRLWSLINGTWQYSDYTYFGSAPVKAALSSPASGATLSSTTMFTWTAGNSVAAFYLSVGSTGAGSSDIYFQSTFGTFASVTGIPATGGTIYVRLWSLLSGAWQWNDYTFTAPAGSTAKAVITAPAAGSSINTTAVFTWTTGSGVSLNYLYVGTTGAGSSDVYAQVVSGTTTTVSGLPTGGGTLYVRLFSLISGAWQFNDYTYTTPTIASGRGAMVLPVPGATLAASSQTFTWTAGSGVSLYYLSVGTAGEGSSDIAFQLATTPSATITGLPAPGNWVYVRLWSLISGSWQYYDYTYRR